MLLSDLSDPGHVDEDAIPSIQTEEEGLKGLRSRNRILQFSRALLQGADPLPGCVFLLLDSHELAACRSHSILKLGGFVLDPLNVLAERITLSVQRRQANVEDTL